MRLLLIWAALLGCYVDAWSDSKVKLTNVQTITLYHGRMTTGRRSSPVPQAQCVGGSAGCSAFVPQVIQCHNKGSDGIDVQWECKSDMDNLYRFGRIDVLCEGYDYPDDPYILKGSCGLEYTLDLTKEGIHKQESGHNYYGSDSYSDYGGATARYMPKSNILGDIIPIVVGLLIMYGVYKTCINQVQRTRRPSGYTDPQNHGTYGFPSAPPPPGFRTNLNDEGCMGSGTSYQRPSTGASNFWTGAATGGMLGYMLGSRNRGTGSFYEPYHGTTTTTNRNRSHSFGSFGGSSGTRTASGFGGTKRR